MKKKIFSLLAIGILMGIIAISASASSSNSRITAGLNANRNSSTHLVTATPIGIRTGATAEHSIRMRIHSNAITVVNGVTSGNNLRTDPWTTQGNPRRNHSYRGPQRTRTIRQGFVESQVEVRRAAINLFGSQVRQRLSWN